MAGLFGIGERDSGKKLTVQAGFSPIGGDTGLFWEILKCTWLYGY